MSAQPGQETPDFSLVLGGPLYQLLRRTRLTDDTLQLVRRRVIALSMFAWLPLLLLSALGGGLVVPFLQDLAVQIRLLVAMPILIAAELVVHQRMRFIVRQFLDRGLIPDPARPRFDAAVASVYRLRNSISAELLIIGLVYAVNILFLWRAYLINPLATWYSPASASGHRLSMAGRWYVYLSLPLFQFLLCRWYYRILIWTRFLWQVSRIRLNLVPTHPDHLGGLGFLPGIVHAFTPLATAHGFLLAAMMANRIFYFGATLPQFKAEVAIMAGFLLCLIQAPLLVFLPQLSQAKRTGLREYGVLAQRYVREFDAKWLRGGAPADEPLVGSGDIQSLADLGTSHEVVRSMRIVPVTKQLVLQTLAAAVLPIAPLALTMMSLETLLKKLVGILF